MAYLRKYPFNFESIYNPYFLDKYTVMYNAKKYIIGIGLTSRCNFHCPMCYYHEKNGEFCDDTDISIELLKKIFDGSCYFKAVNFALEGEPLCYPHLFQALDYAQASADAISIATNGSLLTKEMLRRFSEYRFSLFSLSIDTADEQSYAYFRKGGTLSTFIRHTEMATALLGNVVIFNTVLFQQNLEAVLGLPELAFRTGVSTIGLMQLRPHRGARLNGITPAIIEDLLLCLEKLIENAARYNITLYFDEFFGDEKVTDWLATKKSQQVIVSKCMYRQCEIPWYYTSILSSGKIFPCCGDFHPVKVDSYTFDGIFNHDYLRMLRGHIAEGKNVKACALCRHERLYSA